MSLLLSLRRSRLRSGHRTCSRRCRLEGLNPKIAAFVPKDIEDEGLDAWLEEYGDVFGGQPQTTGQADPRSAEINRMNAVDQGVNHSRTYR